jgi:hypothetical protein
LHVDTYSCQRAQHPKEVPDTHGWGYDGIASVK